MTALDPKTCSRCRATITADDPKRPESITGHIFAPANPRPQMPSGQPVDWEIAADYSQPGSVAALLCPACTIALRDWIYSSGQTVDQFEDCHHDPDELETDEHRANCLYDPDAARRLAEREGQWDAAGVSGYEL